MFYLNKKIAFLNGGVAVVYTFASLFSMWHGSSDLLLRPVCPAVTGLVASGRPLCSPGDGK